MYSYGLIVYKIYRNLGRRALEHRFRFKLRKVGLLIGPSFFFHVQNKSLHDFQWDKVLAANDLVFEAVKKIFVLFGVIPSHLLQLNQFLYSAILSFALDLNAVNDVYKVLTF